MDALSNETALLAEFSRSRSPDALDGLVRRYVDLLYATAVRLVGDSHVAEDVTQAAFLVLMKKADRLDPHTLPGWLVNTTRLAAKEALRSDRLRHKHEPQAAALRSPNPANPSDDPTAAELLPLLDDALSQLSEADRSAVVLRFLQGQSFAEVGRATGSSEDAARKRVGRAVEKLRTIFMKQGLVASAGGLMIILAAEQAKAAPVTLAASITTAAATGGAGTSAILAKGVTTMATWAKIKVAAIVAGLLLAVGGTGAGIVAIRRTFAEPPAASPQAQLVAHMSADPNFIGSISSGVSVELIGVAENPSDAKPWWRPDGLPLADRPYQKSNGEYVVTAQSTAYEFAAKLTQPAQQTGEYSIDGADDYGNGVTFVQTPTDASGKPVDVFEGVTAFAKTETSATLRLQIMFGPWTDAKSIPADFSNKLGELPTVQVAGGTFSFLKTASQNGQIVLSVERPIPRETDVAATRLVARDRSGKTFLSTGGHTATANGKITGEMSFPLKVQDAVEFSVQYQMRAGWVEFRNVSLKAGMTTAVQIVTSDDANGPAARQSQTKPSAPTNDAAFGSVIQTQLVGNNSGLCQIDLDTGVLQSGPNPGDYPLTLAGFSEWRKKTGMDVVGAVVDRALMGFDMVVVGVDNAKWDIAPAEFGSTLSRGKVEFTTQMPVKDGAPTTWLFQTREGSQGVLQVIGLTPDGQAIQFRYKLLRDQDKKKLP